MSAARRKIIACLSISNSTRIEQKIRLLEKQKTLKKTSRTSDKKAIFCDMMINMAEKELNIPIRKNSLPKQSSDSQENTK